MLFNKNLYVITLFQVLKVQYSTGKTMFDAPKQIFQLILLQVRCGKHTETCADFEQSQGYGRCKIDPGQLVATTDDAHTDDAFATTRSFRFLCQCIEQLSSLHSL